MQKEKFKISGMTCSACSSRVNRAVESLDGVEKVNVNLLKNNMTVTFDESRLTPADIAGAVAKAGYGATLEGADRAGEGPIGAAEGDAREMKGRLIVSFLFTGPLFYISMGHMAGLPIPAFLAENALAFAFTQFLLTIPVMFVNFKYYRVGFKTLFSLSPNMDSLIAIGSGAAAVFGVYTIYKMAFALGAGEAAAVHHLAMNLYFESAAMILTLITLGKFFEARAKGKTSEAIARLMDLAPPTATVVRDGAEKIIPREEVRVGDTVVVKAGESIAVDGEVIEGAGFVDESAVTGESLPLEKGPGDSVTGATINKSGHFLMRAVRVGEDTTLAQIVRLVDEATSSKAPIARLADRVSGVFVPVVILIALSSAAVWLALGYDVEFALSIGISVLVISCPCALGLATPTAIMVGTGRGAAFGILLKSAEAIETAGRIDTVALDKTGTVTHGRPQVTDILTAPGVTEDELLTKAASIEKLSEHPLGAAVVKEAEKRGLTLNPVTGFSQIPGRGLAANLGGARLTAGNAHLMEDESVALGPLLERGRELAEEGRTALYFGWGGSPLGLIAVADVIKETSRQAVEEFRALGLRVVMLTGDNLQTARAVGWAAGIENVAAEVLPQDKEKEIRRLQAQGRKVAMVGDGINDAPALARADVGLAIGAGTDVAMESADIVLMKSDLLDAVTAMELSRAVMRNIRQNLFWAFFYNVVGIPVAAGVFYGLWGLTLNPMIAALAMSLSSVSVVSNALRLRFFKPRHLAENSQGQAAEGAARAKPIIRSNMKTIINIEGMNCGHCTGSVEKGLKAMEGVSEVMVDLASKTATIEAAEGVTESALKQTITDLGFTVTGFTKE